MVGQGNHPMQKTSRDDGAEVLRWSQPGLLVSTVSMHDIHPYLIRNVRPGERLGQQA